MSSTPLWLAVAAGSVAILLLAAHRRRRAEGEERELLLRDGPFRWVAGDEALLRPSAARREPFVECRDSAPAAVGPSGSTDRDSPPAVNPAVWNVPEYSVELPLPGVHRAALAISLGQPAELRRLALDLEQAGREAEAGLLGNYALLLERSNVSRERVMAEVARMLRAAVAERRSTQRTRRSASVALPPGAAPSVATPSVATPSVAAPSVAASVAITPSVTMPIAPPVASPSIPGFAPTAAASTASRPRAVIPLPVFAVGARRRAAR